MTNFRKVTLQQIQMAEEQVQATSDEILIEKLQKNVELVCKGTLEERLEGVNVLIDELKLSTSSMTSVPKPMKHLIPCLDDLTKAFHTFTNAEFKRKLADLLSLLAIVSIDTSYDILLYRLESPIENIGCWGHEYVRCLTLALIKGYKNPDELPANIDLATLIGQISAYYMYHNDEPDACDLLLNVDQLEDIVNLVDEDSHKRVCTYLMQCYNYLPDPYNTKVLIVLNNIYQKLGKTAQALVIALKLNDNELMHDTFRNCTDPSVKRQLAFLLARQLTVFDDEDDQQLINISTNVDLYRRYMDIAEKLSRRKPKTPDDVLQLQATIGARQGNRNDKMYSLIAKSFVAAFHNAALKDDLYYTAPRGEECVYRNRSAGRAVAVASLGMLNLWDIENGPNSLDKWIRAEDEYIVMGGLTGIGIMSSAVRSEYDPPLALIPEHFSNSSNEVKIGALFGLAMAYAGSARRDVLEHIQPLLNNDEARVRAYAYLAIGLVYVGTCNEDALMAVSQPMIDAPEDQIPNKFLPIIALGLGLIYLGQQSKCEVALELLKSATYPLLSSFAQATVSSCAYAGSGNVLEIQKLLSICTLDDSLTQAAAVLGVASIAVGDSVGCQMSKRMFEHILQYGKSYARRMVPLAIALTSISQPLPETVDTLHRIGHDTDINVASNAAIALGLLAAGTQNSRTINVLKALAGFHKGNQSTLMLLQIAEGMTHLGQGLMTLSPTYGDSTLVHPVALGSLLTVAFACIQTEDLIVKTDPLLLFFIAPAIGPRFLVTLDEDLQILPLQVRVGSAIDVVGQAGRPRAITGFQTLDTPVVLAAGQRAEFVDDTYEPLSPILEGFVIMRKRPDKKVEA